MASDDETKPLPRRDFLNLAIGGSGVAFALSAGSAVARFVEPPGHPLVGQAIVGKVEEFPIGVVRTVLVEERPVLVFRGTDGQFRAVSALCTHLQCVVRYVAERAQIECPCHGGVFSLEGENIAGPPPRPLRELAVTVNDGSVIVSAIG